MVFPSPILESSLLLLQVGFAKIALRTRCPIVPVFTVNIREAFRSLGLFRSCFRWLYQKTRLPLVPLYGGLPVKLRTVVGRPIEYDPDNCTPEQLRDLCRDAIQGAANSNSTQFSFSLIFFQ